MEFEELLNSGIQAFQAGNYQMALALFDQTLNLNLKNPHTWIYQGMALIQLERYAEAILSLESAIELNPYDHHLRQLQQETPGYEESCGELHHAIGDARYQEGRQQENPYPYWREAKKNLQKALKCLHTETFPEKHLEVLLDLVTVCRGLGQVELAQELLRHGTDLLGRLLWAIPSDGQKILLERRFARLNQLRIDELVQSGKPVEALELAEERKNACLTWLRYGWSDTVASPKYHDIQKLLNSHTAAIYWHVSPVAITFELDMSLQLAA